MSLLSWSVRALDAAGAIAAFAMGLIVALVGGLGWLGLMVVFTAIGVAATRAGKRVKQARQTAEARDGERGIRNVVANGAAAMLAAIAVTMVDPLAAKVAFATAIAAVMADTLASEIGGMAGRARRILPPFEAGIPGQNGCVSWTGQVAAAMGAMVIATAAIWLIELPAGLAWIPAVAGFAGCQLDSLLGATLEKDELHDRPLSKEDVNFLASAVPALIVLVALA